MSLIVVLGEKVRATEKIPSARLLADKIDV